jgi:protein subunit release factor B
VKEVELRSRVKRIKFTIEETDLREEFIKGFGPGGQKTNKSNNCVVLKHVPTGIVVRCHDSRDQLVNRKLARKLLYDKLDVEINQETSKIVMRDARRSRTKDRMRRRREAKMRGEPFVEEDTDDTEGSEKEEDYTKYDDIKLDKIGKDIK